MAGKDSSLRELARALAENSDFVPRVGTTANLSKPRASKKSYREFVEKFGPYLDTAANEFATEAGYSEMDPISKLGFDPYVISMLLRDPMLMGVYNNADSTLGQYGGIADSIEINKLLATKDKAGEVSERTKGTIAHESRHRGFDRIKKEDSERIAIHKMSEEIVNRVYDFVHRNSQFGEDVLVESGVPFTPSYLKDITKKRKSPDKFNSEDSGEYAFWKYREYEQRAKDLMDLLYNSWMDVK